MTNQDIPDIELPLDGYGLPFDPIKHLMFITNGLKEHEKYLEYKRLNPPKYVEPEPKPYPAGWYSNKGSGV